MMMFGSNTLSQCKRQLLQYYLHGIHSPSDGLNARAIRRAAGERAPLAAVQERLWYRCQVPCAPPLYNETITMRRTGPLNVAALRRALREIVRRHEAWRTTFRAIDGQPWQIIQSAPEEFPLAVINLRNAADAESKWVQIATDEVSRPFNLESGPVVRATLAIFSELESRLLVTAHQMIVDGISVYQIFPTELSLLYEAYCTNQGVPLPALPLQYSDFCIWHRNRLHETTLKNHLDYWVPQFANMPSALPWPPEWSSSSAQTHRGAIQGFTLSKALVDKLKAFGRDENISLFTLLVSALTVLLWRYTEREDIMIGTPVAVGRERSEFQVLLGYFLNPVPLRVRTTNHPSFSEISLRVQQSIRGALAHSNVPLYYVVESLALEPNRVWDSAFAVSISLAPPLPALQGGWSMMPMEFASGGSQWNLYLEFSESQSGMIGRIQYNPDVFKVSTILAVMEDFQSVLEHGMANPEQRLSALTNRRNQAAS